MEEKLRQYRARRRRQEFVEKTVEKLENTKRRFVDIYRKMIKINVDVDEEDVAPILVEPPVKKQVSKKSRLEKDKYEENNRNLTKVMEEQKLIENIEMDSETNDEEIIEENAPETWPHFIIKWSIYTAIWVTLFFYFISLQFGAVFFAISLLIGIYLNTGTRPRKKGEASAYSVFNENCESIDGTVTAEKLQKEMFFGSFRLF